MNHFVVDFSEKGAWEALPAPSCFHVAEGHGGCHINTPVLFSPRARPPSAPRPRWQTTACRHQQRRHPTAKSRRRSRLPSRELPRLTSSATCPCTHSGKPRLPMAWCPLGASRWSLPAWPPTPPLFPSRRGRCSSLSQL